jgi:hypothetical protein
LACSFRSSSLSELISTNKLIDLPHGCYNRNSWFFVLSVSPCGTGLQEMDWRNLPTEQLNSKEFRGGVQQTKLVASFVCSHVRILSCSSTLKGCSPLSLHLSKLAYTCTRQTHGPKLSHVSDHSDWAINNEFYCHTPHTLHLLPSVWDHKYFDSVPNHLQGWWMKIVFQHIKVQLRAHF